jgi:hypothetical protein
MSPETERLRNEVADVWDIHPVEQWSPAFLRAMIALLEIEISSGISEHPAPVLQLVPRQT